MGRNKSSNQIAAKSKKRCIEQYDHKGKKRINNPPVGRVTPDIQPVLTVKPGKDLDYDAHLDPQLLWAGKKEHSSFANARC